LTSTTGYRITDDGWKQFRIRNNLVVEETDQKKRKGKKTSPKAKGSKGKSSSPSLKPNGDRTKQEIDNVCIDLWVFRSPKLKLGYTDHEKGALGMVLLHYREEDRAKHVHFGRAGECDSEDSMELDGPDHQAEAMPDVGEGAHEMVMAKPNDVPEEALALPPVVVDAVGPPMDMDGSTTLQRELEAAEGLLLWRGRH
jgi:hypothetical protein